MIFLIHIVEAGLASVFFYTHSFDFTLNQSKQQISSCRSLVYINITVCIVFLKIMIETYLITKAHEYREAWNKLLPSMWDWVKEDCSDVLCDQEEDEIGSIDNGKLRK